MEKDLKKDIILSVGEEVEKFINTEMRLPEETWQPSDYIPDFSNPEFQDELKKLQTGIRNIPDTVLMVLIGNMITEEALPSYQTYFNLIDGVNETRNVAAESPWVRWSRVWTAEENRHGDLLNKYLYLSGRVNMKEVEISIHRLLYNGFNAETEGNMYQSLVYTSFQERATKVSHTNTGSLAFKSGDELLSKICKIIAGEEARHEKAYKKFMKFVFEKDPNGAVEAFGKMMEKQIAMPAKLIDTGETKVFDNYSAVAQDIGIYTIRDYADIIEHLVGFWEIGNLKNLNATGVFYQDLLCNLSSRYYRLADRKRITHEVKTKWLKSSPYLIA